MPDPVGKPEPLPLAGVEELIKRVGGLRDGIIAAAGILYLVGYGVWSYNAWRNNLGILPALQPQYFLAGFPPVLWAVSMYLLYRVFLRIIYAGIAWVETPRRRVRVKRRLLVLCITALFVVVMMGLLAFAQASAVTNAIGWGLALIVGVLMPMMMGTGPGRVSLQGGRWIRVPWSQYKEAAAWSRRVDRIFHRLFAAGFPILLAFVGVNVYTNTVYPNLAQEFGGTRPRSAYLAVTRAQIPLETREAILPDRARKLPADPAKDSAPVVRTLPLDVLYQSGDSMMVRPHGALRGSTVYEIKKSSVQGVTWIGYTKPPVKPASAGKTPSP